MTGDGFHTVYAGATSTVHSGMDSAMMLVGNYNWGEVVAIFLGYPCTGAEIY
jgi:hypothetical protein